MIFICQTNHIYHVRHQTVIITVAQPKYRKTKQKLNNQSFIYSPTVAPVSCLENNIKIYIKTAPDMFRCYSYTIIMERINLCLLMLQLIKQSIKINKPKSLTPAHIPLRTDSHWRSNHNSIAHCTNNVHLDLCRRHCTTWRTHHFAFSA